MMMNRILRGACFIVLLALAFSCKEEDPNTQINAEVSAIDAYLDANPTGSVIYDQSGVRIVVGVAGENAPPHAGQNVTFTYTLKLFSNGQVIESGTITDKLDNMPTDGLRYGLMLTLSGGSSTLYVPSKFGYGEQGTSSIPGNSTLVYEIVLREVTRTAAEQTQFSNDTTAIHQYLTTNSVQGAVKHSSGVWYKIDADGTGAYPTPYDNVAFQYKVIILSNGATAEQGDQQTNVYGLIDGLKVGLPHMKEGGSATFYIPSGLAYGTQPNSGRIPLNAILIFTIQLKSVTPSS